MTQWSTCYVGVFDAEAKALELFITGEFDPHEATGGCDHAGALRPAVTVDEWGETEGTISYLQVIETALKRGLDVVVFVKDQLDSLARQSWGSENGKWDLVTSFFFRRTRGKDTAAPRSVI